MIKKASVIICFSIFFVSAVNTGDHIKTGIDEQSGAAMPMDVRFKDAAVNDVLLNDLIDDITIPAFVYYKYPGICSVGKNIFMPAIDKKNVSADS
ncbi:hypothetical protein BMS3Abin03_01723 [bacterium BMS3Abin03]|nr:hypothetical protein BMS3Abin03_01723 [bacterium BMS3Abin03]